eukprot:scaffold113701_cov66-Phaeocystis_antarctica.AAC.2
MPPPPVQQRQSAANPAVALDERPRRPCGFGADAGGESLGAGASRAPMPGILPVRIGSTRWGPCRALRQAAPACLHREVIREVILGLPRAE